MCSVSGITMLTKNVNLITNAIGSVTGNQVSASSLSLTPGQCSDSNSDSD